MRTTQKAQAALSLELLNEALNASAVVWVVTVEQPHSSSSDSQQQEGGEAMWLRKSFKGSRRSECAARHPGVLDRCEQMLGPAVSMDVGGGRGSVCTPCLPAEPRTPAPPDNQHHALTQSRWANGDRGFIFPPLHHSAASVLPLCASQSL